MEETLKAISSKISTTHKETTVTQKPKKKKKRLSANQKNLKINKISKVCNQIRAKIK